MDTTNPPKPFKAALPIISACALLAFTLTAVAPEGLAQTAGAPDAPRQEVSLDRGNPQRTGVYATPAKAPAGRVAWESPKLFVMQRGKIQYGPTTRLGDRTGSLIISGPDFFIPNYGFGYSAPVVAGGMLYCSVFIGDGYVYALDARTGELVWRVKREKGVYSSPAVSGETLYLGADGGHFYAFDLKGRQEKWRHTRPDDSAARPSPVVADGLVYYAANNGSLYALDAETGEPRWTFAAGEPNLSAPAAGGKSTRLNSSQHRLDARTGAERWKLRAEEGVRPPVYSDGVVYFRTREGHIRAADAATGRLRPRPRHDHQAGSQIAVDGPTLYFSGWDTGSVFAVDAATRETKWKFSDSSEARCGAPATDGRAVYVTCSDGRLYALDAGTGKKLWKTAPKKAPLSAPVVAGGAVHFVSDDGKVYAVN